MRTTRLVMLAPFRVRRRSPGRRSTRCPARRTVVRPRGDEAGDRERHRQPVVVEAVGRGAARASAPSIARSSPSTLDPRAERARGPPRCRRSGPIPCGAARRRRGSRPCPRAWPAARQSTGISSIAAATSSARDVDRLQRAGAHGQVRDRLADAVVRALARTVLRGLVDSGAHPPQQVDDGPASRVDADAAQGQLGVRMDRPGDQPEGGRRHVRRDPFADRSHASPSLDTPRRSALVERFARHWRLRAPAACARCDRASRPPPGPSSGHRLAAPPAGSPTSPGRWGRWSRSRSPGAGYGRPRSVAEGNRSGAHGAPRPSSAVAR